MKAQPQRIEQKKVQEVASLLIPLAGLSLLLPNVTVAEIVPLPDMVPVEQVPDWYLGDCLWREQRIPVVSFERLNQAALPQVQRTARLAVLNATGVHEELPFIAVLTSGLPRLARVTEEELSVRDGVAAKTFDLLNVSWAGESAVIPDITAMEHILLPWWQPAVSSENHPSDIAPD
ncbi:chemotaxis protein CheW [Cellvibrio polysaccharolyticus]|uniref:Chemotaxis protein CheW n=1 Tax=Cellvibrio polysaccharolyticus TaxID=2082724 RepID=A0A928YVE7_9GAMM|nr:chemotaxis protein CheW [Cellvibrio polysaccharolyticus]MBE8718962.1 chemotaxis protein CheW [Cellvibrio polysaccharolyticus]